MRVLFAGATGDLEPPGSKSVSLELLRTMPGLLDRPNASEEMFTW